MNAKVKKYIAALTALMLISAGVGMVSAAPGSIDGSQDDTSDEVYISDDKTMDDEFNASGDTAWNMTLESVPDSEADDLAMNVTHDDEEYYSFSGEWDEYDDGDPDSDSDTNGYYHAFDDDELDRVPMGINENVTLNVTYWNESADDPSPETAQVYVENTDERSVQRVTENASFADVETQEPPVYRPLSDDYDSVELDDEVDIASDNTTVIYTLDDSAVQDPFANRTEDMDAGGFTLMVASMSGDSDEPVPVFLDETPDWYDEDEMGSYAVYDSSNDLVEFTPSEDNFDGEDSAEVVASSDVYRINDVYKVWNLAGGYSGAGTDAIISMAMG